MPARTALTAEPGFAQVRGIGPTEDERDFPPGADTLRTDQYLQCARRAMLPDVHTTTAVEADGTNAWIHDGTSWVVLSASWENAPPLTRWLAPPVRRDRPH